ncbi:biotin/lipoyl-containing protein [Mariniflexile soesokkakense]|uniref:Biotin/lipoyl-containing protein n=1 Tax=Mariniflexile soesokkakense TaxID=1343160 RepID=A0ABV0AD47_9FLAO
MKKILQFLFPNLFPPDLVGKRTVVNLKSDLRSQLTNDNSKETEISFKLEAGKIQTVNMPNVRNQDNFEVIEWLCKVGDVVKRGQIICVLENENISMEFESFTEAKILYICDKHIVLYEGDVLFKLRGV